MSSVHGHTITASPSIHVTNTALTIGPAETQVTPHATHRAISRATHSQITHPYTVKYYTSVFLDNTAPSEKKHSTINNKKKPQSKQKADRKWLQKTTSGEYIYIDFFFVSIRTGNVQMLVNIIQGRCTEELTS